MNQHLMLNAEFRLSQVNTSGGTSNYDFYQPPVYYHIVREYYPTYQAFWHDESKIEKAFKVTHKLFDKKLIQIPTVKDFIEIVNDIATVI